MIGLIKRRSVNDRSVNGHIERIQLEYGTLDQLIDKIVAAGLPRFLADRLAAGT